MAENTKQQNAIVAAGMQMNGAGLVLQSAQDLKLISELFHKGGLVPQCFDTTAKVAVAVQAGAELGFKPWQSIQNLHVVNGQIGIKSTAIGGLIRNSGKCKFLKQGYNVAQFKLDDDCFAAIITSQRTDDPTMHTTEFSIADARAAGLWGKDNWKRYPKDMLMWRALSRHGRQFYGDVLSGFYSVDELQEITPPEAQPTPEALSREERKKVDAKVTDTPATIAELAEESLNFFDAAVTEKLGRPLGGDTFYYFTQCVSYILRGDADSWKDHKNWTIEGANKLLKELKENGIPQAVLDMIPHQMSEAAVEKNAEEKFGQESTEKGDLKYQCQSPNCGKYFDEPKQGGKLPGSDDYAKLCPFCLTDDIVNREGAASVSE